jgi:hypothetical protein
MVTRRQLIIWLAIISISLYNHIANHTANTMYKSEIPILFSSSPNDGATNISADGSRFTVILDEPLLIPSDAKQCYVSVPEVTAWNVFPNIITGINDLFYLDGGAGYLTVIVPQGLYDLSGLQEAIDREYVSLGGVTGIFSFIADDATQKVVIQLNIAGVQIDFTQNQTMRDILGFNAQLVPPLPSVGVYTQYADFVAGFNSIEYLLVHSDLVLTGIRTNSSFTQTIAKASITATPGSQIIYQPFNPPRSNSNNLIGTIKNRLNFWLTDQSNNPVNTNGEFWSIRLVIEYTI